MTGGLKIDEAAALAVVGELAASELLESVPGEPSRLRLTEAGRTLNGTIRAAVGELTARIYGDLPREDLATAGRVLTLVTERANAVLDGAR